MKVGPNKFKAYQVSRHPHYVFPRWRPSYHRVHYVGHHPHWHPAYWGRGVFVYSPPPRHVVVKGETRTVEGGGNSQRAVDRNGDLAVGIRAGSYHSAYDNGYGAFGDFGMGIGLRYRPVESLGLELGWQYHDETFSSDTERITRPLQASVQLFAFPWTRVSPYFTAGLTWTGRSYSDTYYDGFTYKREVQDSTLFGPHAGIGLEFAVGENVAIDLEGRTIGYLNVDDEDNSLNGALQGTMGLNFYF